MKEEHGMFAHNTGQAVTDYAGKKALKRWIVIRYFSKE
jgi:hypothetical protein